MTAPTNRDMFLAAAQSRAGESLIDRILALPMVSLARTIETARKNKTFTLQLFAQVAEVLKGGNDMDLQIDLAHEAIATGTVAASRDIKLHRPDQQLLWAAAIACMEVQDTQTPVQDKKIWQQLLQTGGVYNENIFTADLIYTALQNENAAFGWGAPGSWFYYNLQKNYVNRDLYYSLLVGFENARSIVLHEIGHSQLTNGFLPSMEKLKTDMDAIQTAGGEKKTVDEQKELARIAAAWHLRMRFFNFVEDICVDKYAIDMQYRYNQDFGMSLNHAAVLLRGYADIYTGNNSDVTDMMASVRADVLGGVMRELDGKTPEKTAKSAAGQMLPQQALDDICAGRINKDHAERLFNMVCRASLLSSYVAGGLFDGGKERWQKFEVFAEEINGTIDVSHIPAARGMTAFEYLCAVSSGARDSIRTAMPQPEDRILRRNGKSAADSYRDVVRETTQQRYAMIEYIWDVFAEKFADVLINDVAEKVEQRLNSQQDTDRQDNPQQQENSSDGDGKDGNGNSGGGAQDMDSLVDDLVKSMQTPDTETADGQGQAAQDDSAVDNQTVGKWRNRKTRDADDAANSAAPDNDNTPEKTDLPAPGDAKSGIGAGSGRGVDLETLQKGSWNDYHQRVGELAPYIQQVERKLRKIREQQRKVTPVRSRSTYDLLPENGDITGMLDQGRVLSGKFKAARREPMTVEDYKRFYKTGRQTEESAIEVVCALDTSASMIMNRLGGSTAMEVALQSTAIIYESCRRAGIDCFIMIWGGDPQIIATPHTPREEVGVMLEALRRGTHSGTDLAPGLVKTVKMIADHKNKNGTISGMSNMLIFSDGDIHDESETRAVLGAVNERTKNLSMDVAVLRPAKSCETRIETVFADEAKKFGQKAVTGVIAGTDPARVPEDLVDLILRRVCQRVIKTEPDRKKRAILERAYRSMLNAKR